jgi:hypothetical protein
MPGIFSSLASYSKRVIHSYFDLKGTLPEYLAFWVTTLSVTLTANDYITPAINSWMCKRAYC